MDDERKGKDGRSRISGAEDLMDIRSFQSSPLFLFQSPLPTQDFIRWPRRQFIEISVSLSHLTTSNYHLSSAFQTLKSTIPTTHLPHSTSFFAVYIRLILFKVCLNFCCHICRFFVTSNDSRTSLLPSSKSGLSSQLCI